MRYRVERTARTWVLIGIALILSFVIAYCEHRRRLEAPPPPPAEYQIEFEIPTPTSG